MKNGKIKKMAAVILASSISAGAGFGMVACKNGDNESDYATKLYDRLAFKMEKDFDLCGENVDLVDYNYAIVKGEPTIGLTLTALSYHYHAPLEKDILEARYVVDKEFYDKFTNSDLEDLKTLYSLSDEMIINYDPSTIKLNGQIVYQSQPEATADFKNTNQSKNTKDDCGLNR